MQSGRNSTLAIGAYASAITAALTFCLYFASSPPSVGLWDTAEYQTVAWIAGIPHPTGFPAFVMTGWLFTHLLPFGNPAWRLTMMAAASVALSCALLVASLCRFGVKAPNALASGALFALGELTWIHATRAGHESLSLLFSVLAIVHGIVWARQHEPRALVLTGLFTGLTLTTHPIALWYVPGLAILVIVGLRQGPIPWRALAASAGSGLALLSLYAYLPIRSAVINAQGLDPTVSLGMPPGQQIWNCDNPATLTGFLHLVSGAGFNATSYLSAFWNPVNYPTFLQVFVRLIVAQDGIVVALLAIYGISLSLRYWPLLCALAGIAFLPVCVAYVVTPIEGDVTKFYLVTLWILAWLAGLGAHKLAEKLPPMMIYVPALALAFIACTFFQAEESKRFAQRTDRSGDQVIEMTVLHTEDNAVINGMWSYVTPLGYGKYVQHKLGERIPVPIAEKKELLAWSRTRPVYWVGPPDSSLLSIPGAIVTLVPDTWPRLYRIMPAR